MFQICDLDIYLPSPKLPRHLRERRDRPLRQVPIPLRPHRFFAVGEIEGIDDIASLPAIALAISRSERCPVPWRRTASSAKAVDMAGV